MPKKIRLPYKFKPRHYQLPLFKAMDSGYKRAVCVWHRRAGKDKTMINLVVKKAFERVGAYYYYFPTAAQGRKIIWDGIDKSGMPFLAHIPGELIAKKNEQEMKIRLINGSLFQVVGTDRLEVVGPNPVGCIFSEYSLQNPSGWEYVRPILAENEGWAIFNYTPRGMNHGYRLFQMAESNPDWFCQLLTVDDTGAISQEAIDAERRAGMSEEMIQQEFYCSWEYGLEGAYWLKQLAKLRKEGRLTHVPYDEEHLVYTVWDIGMRDTNAIWFVQFVGLQIRLIDYYQATGEGIAHYARILDEKGYIYGGHIAPHDIRVKEWGTGMTRWERAKKLGIEFRIVPNIPIQDGIDAVRAILPRCWFDQEKCWDGFNALLNYQKEWDERLQRFKTNPLHNWASHAADAFRYLAVSLHMIQPEATGGALTEQDIQRMEEQYLPPIGMN